MQNIIYIIFSLMVTELYSNSCIVDIGNRDIVRNEFTFHETIQSEHFVIHFTTADVDSQLVFGVWYNLQSNFGYAQSIIDHLEAAYSIFISDGWESPPPDCDETITNPELPQHCDNFGGNPLYDVYIANDAAGMVVPETLYPVEPYTGGYSSFMKISTLLNEHDVLPWWSYHVVAHELHHAIQMRYGYSVSGEPGNYMYNGWLFEQTASYMENVIYPNNIHLSTMLSNCNITTPLTYPEYNIDYPGDLYQYRSALWQKYMVESFGDSSIIRLIWENYGIQYSSGDPVSLFPIYNNAIQFVTNNEFQLSDAYSSYAVWRYFTGNRALAGEYFLDGQIYCDASVIEITDDVVILPSEKGATRLIQLESDNINLQFSSSFAALIQLQHVTESGIVNNFELTDNISYLNISNPNNESHALVLTSKYTGNSSQEMEVNISLNSLQGDINGDGMIDILDIIILVNMILDDEYNSIADLNEDGELNILDVVTIVNLVLYGDDDTCIDIDGNVYETVQIGGQLWMAENLKVAHFNNGDEIPTGYSASEWDTIWDDAYAVYDDDPSNAENYGNLYNWFAVDDSRGICPQNYHIPTDDEWYILLEYLGGAPSGSGENWLIAGGKMKDVGTIEDGDGLWYAPNEGATNESGFTAIPAGFRLYDGQYYESGYYSIYWSSTAEYYSDAFFMWYLLHDDSRLYRGLFDSQTGLSIRCLKD